MKVESQYTIDGNVVTKEFENSDLIVYDYQAAIDERIIYFVSKRSGNVMFKQEIGANMGQGCGYISGIDYIKVD